MKFIFYILSCALSLLGLIFIIAGANPLMPGRIIVGSILVIGGIALVIAARMKPTVKKVHVTQKIDLAGDVSLEQLTCRSCNAPLNKENITLKDGAVFVQCPYCSAAYQMEEKPKW